MSAKIETDRKPAALAVPIESLTIREPGREEEKWRRAAGAKADADTAPAPAGGGEEEGVFRVENGRARFVAIATGIAGEKDFEVVSGLSEGEEIVRGSFEALRKLESGQKVKRAKEKRAGASNAKAGEDERP